MDIFVSCRRTAPHSSGANGLTDGAASVAKRFHIPSIVIGLTIVAFGTSAPELTVSISSALKAVQTCHRQCGGKQYVQYPDDCGLYGPFAPIAITRNTLKREIPFASFHHPSPC